MEKSLHWGEANLVTGWQWWMREVDPAFAKWSWWCVTHIPEVKKFWLSLKQAAQMWDHPRSWQWSWLGIKNGPLSILDISKRPLCPMILLKTMCGSMTPNVEEVLVYVWELCRHWWHVYVHYLCHGLSLCPCLPPGSMLVWVTCMIPLQWPCIECCWGPCLDPWP